MRCKSLLSVLSLLVLVAVAAAPSSYAVGAREPLTFRNTGLYGVWNEYFLATDSPFDFLIIQAYVYEDRVECPRQPAGDTTTWNQWLKRARANGKRVIAVVCPAAVDETGKLQTLASQFDEKQPLPIERFEKAMDRFFEEVDEEELYAITLAEENVFWNGQSERLEHMYAHVKKKHQVPVYQWYTPSHTSSIPGLNYPNLKADGWMADEYFLQQPLIEKAMRGYTVQQKPVFQLMWALPQIHAVPSAELTFWEQYATCRKYNIPIAFYFWVGVGEGPIRRDRTWDPTATPIMRKIFEDYCIHGSMLARRLPPVPATEWDFVPWEQKRIVLNVDAANSARARFEEKFQKRREEWGASEAEAARAALYFEEFKKPRELAIWNDASITGFAHLKWDSSPVQLCPRVAGPAESTISYRFQSPGKISSVRTQVNGTNATGNLLVELLDERMKIVAKSEMREGIAAITWDAPGDAAQEFTVRVTLSGNAAKAGDVLATFDSIAVECGLAQLPAELKTQPSTPTQSTTNAMPIPLITRHELSISAGEKMSYLVSEPTVPTEEKDRWLVVYLYGAGGTLEDYNLAQHQYAKIREGLARQGAFVVVPDLGKSHFMNGTSQEALTKVIDQVLAGYRIDPAHVHLVGTSMGGGSSLAYAVHHPEKIRSVCAIMPMTDFADWITQTPQYAPRVEEAYGGNPTDKPGIYSVNSAIKHADALAKIPVLLVHGTADEIVLPSHSRKLAAAIVEKGGWCTLREVKGMGHSDDIVTGLQDEIVDFLINANR